MDMNIVIAVGEDGVARFQCDECGEWHPLSELIWVDEDGNELEMPNIRVTYAD